LVSAILNTIVGARVKKNAIKELLRDLDDPNKDLIASQELIPPFTTRKKIKDVFKSTVRTWKNRTAGKTKRQEPGLSENNKRPRIGKSGRKGTSIFRTDQTSGNTGAKAGPSR